MSIQITFTGVQAQSILDRASKMAYASQKKAMYRIAQTVTRTARAYSPISPTAAQLAVKNAITGRARPERRNPNRTSGPKPGSLMRAIKGISDATSATIFVPSNSRAGRYATKIHDEKGKTWHNRGIGTKARGPKADEKFISRAITDNQGNILKILESELAKVGQ